jgi:DNA (cytosine-5)-methyltransferase 1
MTAFYNEIDPYAAAWLRNLIAAGHIAPGVVDTRSISEITPEELLGYTQCHFFAGIGGWSYALRLAGWGDSRPAWTGSCPCQPFSRAGHSRAKRHADNRDLWPVWSRLIAASKPGTVLGEQVVDAGSWVDVVCDDLEELGYEVGAAVLPAVAVGFDHARNRIYFAGHTHKQSESGRTLNAEAPWLPRHRGVAAELALEDGLSRRVGAMRAYGNAIVPQVAAEFIAAYMDQERT